MEGAFTYVNGPSAYKATGTWGVAGPGVTAEWSSGGESEWSSMGVPPMETKAECQRSFNVSRAGTYAVWVRYYDHLKQTEPFRVTVTQGSTSAITGELGVTPVINPNDEYMLYWGFTFGWANITGELQAGPATISLTVDKTGEQWRQLDAVLVTDDLDYIPLAREKPRFAYVDTVTMQPEGAGTVWRGAFPQTSIGATTWHRPLMQPGGHNFTMWSSINYGGTAERLNTSKYWGNVSTNAATATLYDVFFATSPPPDIADQFHTQFAGRKDVPIMSWPRLTIGIYLNTPDFTPGSPLLSFLQRTKASFFILTNYASPSWNGSFCRCPRSVFALLEASTSL